MSGTAAADDEPRELAAARLDRGVIVEREIVLEPGETIRLLRLPNPRHPGITALDRRCLLYRDERLRVATFHCIGEIGPPRLVPPLD